MARLSQSVNVDEVEPGGDFEPLPAGTYVAFIDESNVKETKEKTGEILAVKWKIVEEAEKYAGRTFWQNINYLNASSQAQLIGQQQLKAICEAVGHAGHLEDSEVLHNVPCLVRVGMEYSKEKNPDGTDKYPPKNKVLGVKPVEAATPGSKPEAKAPAAKAAAPAKAGAKAPAKPGGSAPWRKGKAA